MSNKKKNVSKTWESIDFALFVPFEYSLIIRDMVFTHFASNTLMDMHSHNLKIANIKMSLWASFRYECMQEMQSNCIFKSQSLRITFLLINNKHCFNY